MCRVYTWLFVVAAFAAVAVVAVAVTVYGPLSNQVCKTIYSLMRYKWVLFSFTAASVGRK